MNASTVTKTNRAYGLVRRSKPYYHTTGGGGKEEQQQEQEQEQEEGRRRNGPAELRLSKRGQSRQAKCSCRGARPGCRGNTGGGRGGSAVRYATHRCVAGRVLLRPHWSRGSLGPAPVARRPAQRRASAPRDPGSLLPRRYSNGRQCRPLSGVATRHCRRIGFATGQRASIASITLTSSRIILSEFYPWGEVFLSSPNVYNRLTQFAGPGMAEQRDAVGSGAGATRASMRKGCGWAATPTMASRIGAPAAAGNTSQASSGYPRRHFLCLRDRIANVGRAQLRSSSVPPRRCPSRSSPPRESSCGGGSTSSEGALRLGQGAGAASCCSARNMSEFASGRTTACLEGTTKPRSNRTTRPPSNGSVSRKSRSWPPPRRHPFQTAAGCGSTHRMDNPGGGRRWC